MFTFDNGGDLTATGVGVDYLEVCRRAVAGGCADASDVIAAVQAVLAGESVQRDHEYPCPSPTVGRWFALRVTRVEGDIPGALVSHINITVKKTLEKELDRTASLDPLTGLANRLRFAERVRHALEPGAAEARTADVGLLYLDVDEFKLVNDTFGHATGDEVLQTVAGRLTTACRPEDTVARLGGDEFAIVSPRIDAKGLDALKARLKRALSEPHLIHGRDIAVPVSVGSYLASPGEPFEEVVHCADVAMYAAKRARRRRATRTN